MGLLNVYHLYHVCQALRGIEIKQSELGLEGTSACAFIFYILGFETRTKWTPEQV